MCVIPVSNYTCKHLLRHTVSHCKEAKRSGIGCEPSSDQIFEHPFRYNPCFNGEELRLAVGEDMAVDAVVGPLANSNGLREPTAADQTAAPTSMTGNQQISSTYYDERGRSLVLISRYDGRSRTRTYTNAAEVQESNTSGEDLARENSARLQFDGSNDDYDTDSPRGHKHTAVTPAAVSVAISPTANISEGRQDTFVSSTPTGLALAPIESLGRTELNQPGQRSADCSPGTKEEAARRQEAPKP